LSARVDYGIDSPAIVAGLTIAGTLSLGMAVLVHFLGPSHFFWRLGLLAAGVYFLAGAGGMIHYSKVGKLRIRDQTITLIPWRGDELVLDVGCGRGLLLVAAARRLSTGKAIGLDRWLRGALTGNRPEAVINNAMIEQVEDRIAVTNGDVRQLPFGDNVFDVVISNFVLHEVNTPEERVRMLQEIVRVLKPGAHLALVDFIFTGHCVLTLRDAGLSDAQRRRAGSFFSFWFSAAINLGLVRTYVVTGSKPVQ
jgi:SAM-dependent methyltransferase